jgi:hypothetical protein
MARDLTIYLTIGIVTALILIAVRVNRDDEHPTISAFLWICAITLFVWAIMVWLATK